MNSARRLRVGAEIVFDKISDPLGAGEVEIVFGTKIVGDGGDILPGLGGDIAGRGMEAVFAELGDCGGDKLAFRLLALLVIGVVVIALEKLINRLINSRPRFAVCPPFAARYEILRGLALRQPS